MNVSGPEPVRTILLVEDDDQVRGMVRSLLRQNGYRVLEARSGGEGLRLAEAHGEAIDLLLCDMLLPEISGYDLAEKLHVRFPRMRMLFMTGYVEGEIVQRTVGEFGAAFLDKPFQPAVLLRKVHEALNGHADAKA